jgi:hypothetical protein
MFGQSLLSAFGSAACTTDTDQLFATDVQTTSLATYQLNNATTSIPSNTYPGTASNITYAAGKFGNAAVFNGSSSKIDTDADFSGSTATGATISFWFKTSNTSGQTILGSQTGNPSGFAYGSQIYLGNSFSGIPDESIAFINERSGFTESFLTREGSTAYADGNWHHAVFISTNSTKQIWIDGVSKTVYYYQSGSATAQADLTDIALGTSLNASWFNGSIDQVRIFNSALPQAAVTALYNETTTTATYDYVDYQLANPNSVAYYKMSNATDQLGNYNGTATNVNFNTEGKFGFAGAFNGSTSTFFLASAGTSVTNYDSDFSVSMWFNVSSWASAASSDFLWTGGGTRITNLTLTGSNGLMFDLWNSGSNIVSTTGLSENVWYNLVITRSKTAGMVLYINGASVDTNSFTGNAGSLSSQDSLGTYWNNTRNNFTGKIDQVRIYDSVLSAANVTTLYNEIECPPITVDYLVLAGGGGGAGSASNNCNAGGGGAGGLKTTTTYGGSESVFLASLATTYTVEVGPGGAGTSGYDTNGVSGLVSKFGIVGIEITATGGGGGGTYRGIPQNGGSGGGAGSYSNSTYQTPGAASPAGQGNIGGAGMAYNAGALTSGGGGGGAGAAGVAGSGGNAGTGGSGLEVNIIGGTGNFYAGGGGGGGESSGASGGSSIGGTGASANGNGSNGTINTGSGGGGATSTYSGPFSGGNGGSGIVILRYPTSKVSGFVVTGTLNTPTATTVGTDSVLIFTTGTGTIKFS